MYFHSISYIPNVCTDSQLVYYVAYVHYNLRPVPCPDLPLLTKRQCGCQVTVAVWEGIQLCVCVFVAVHLCV